MRFCGDMVLGLDSGARSGVCLMYREHERERVMWSAESKSCHAWRWQVARDAVECAERAQMRLTVWHEVFVGSSHTVRGASMQLGKWLAAFDGHGMPAARVRSVHVSTWRKAVFGHVPRLSADGWKRKAAEWVHQTYAIQAGDDEADAVCIAAYALRKGLR